MKKILVIDGQGGGLGKALVSQLRKALPSQEILALGTNSLATSAMLKAGASAGASGEHAIIWNCRTADIILGAAGILCSGALLGEVSPAMAVAIGESAALKILIPSERCGVFMAGTLPLSLEEAVLQCVQKVVSLVSE